MDISTRLQEYLKKLGVGTTDPTNTGFDPEYDLGVSAGTRDLTTFANRADQENALDQQEKLRSTALLGESRDEGLKGLQQRLSDQGILRSGINVEQQGKMGKEYTRGVDEIERSISNRGLQRESQFKNAQDDFQTKLSQLQLDRSRRQAEKDAAKAEEEARLKALQPVPTPTGQIQPPERIEPQPPGNQIVETGAGEAPQWHAMGFPDEQAYEANRAQPDYDINYINSQLQFMLDKGWDDQAKILLEGMLSRGIPPSQFNPEIMRRFGR